MKKRLPSALLALCLTLSLAVLPTSALTVDQAKQLLETYYVDEIPPSVLELDSLDELLQALGDPYTVYMSAQEYDDFLSSVNGSSVVGIGVSIQTTYNDGFRIFSILPDSPALEAGLEAGDRVVAVDGVEMTASSDIQGAISGASGSSVTVTVIRQADGSRQDFTMTRRAVEIPIVTYELVGDAGVIDCSSFGASTTDTIQEALAAMDSQAAVWILDLRANPGGTSEAAAGSAGLFCGGQVMVYFRDANGNYSYVYTRDTMEDMTDKPLIILTSANSASGSELFAAAARDHAFGIAVGQRTFGKGIAQIALDEKEYPDLFDGDSLKITAYRFYSPDGVTNHTIGILPTLLISPENTAAAAQLLSSKEPGASTDGYLKLELYGFTFYIDLDKAMEKENQAAFTELLESLPTSFCSLWEGAGTGWSQYEGLTPERIAKKLNLPYTSRYNFSDLKESQYAQEIATLAVYGLISGYDDHTFRPTASVTRGEFCAMLASALNLSDTSGTLTFSDVSQDAWYAGAVSAMASRGFISGYGDGTFRPESTISQEEILTILSSVAAWCTMEGYDLAQTSLPASQWTNYQQYSSWAQDPVWRLGQMGVALDSQDPGQAATREVCAHLIYSTMNACGLFWDSPIDAAAGNPNP